MPSVTYSAAGFKWTNENTVSHCTNSTSRRDQANSGRKESIQAVKHFGHGATSTSLSLLEAVNKGTWNLLSSFDSFLSNVLGCCQRLGLGVCPAPLLKLSASGAWQLLLTGLSGERAF